MPNFDALRSAIIGPLAYICRPKEKPAELLCCFPLNDSALDVSRYGVLLPSTPTFYNEGPLGKCASFSGVISHSATTPFSIEMFVKFPADDSQRIRFSCGSYAYAGQNLGQLYYFSATAIILQAIGSNNEMLSCDGTGWNHFAMTYDGSYACAYINGSRSVHRSVGMNVQNTITICSTDIKIANLRVVSKVLGGNSYPVPTGFFTGYEAL